ncbi:hypothetical protein SAY86_016896 [Trapa natans]|uniref:Uncharacterized protein n=1 Tax=Trapa natans TaxID=22666 RepID=A0AAN7M0L0_TRANT|nr:hypothetical protein SAY86_016896 [Trapa natans]
MEIHHLGPLCVLVTALLSLDQYSKLPLIRLLGRRPAEVGFAHFIQLVAGIALFFALSIWLKVLNFGFRPKSRLRPGLGIVDGGCRSDEGSEYSNSEGSFPVDQMFD